MALSIAFLIAHVALVLILFHTRYHTRDLYPWFFTWLAAATVQVGVTVIVPASSVWGNRLVWAPVEALVLALTLAAMAEAVWRRMRLMNRLLRFWLLFGLVVTTFSATAALRGIPSGPYSYPQFLSDRVWLFLWLSIAGVIGFGFGVSKEVRAPTLTRKHLVLYSLLMIAHTAVPDWERWTASNLSYRAVVVVLFIGWSMSAVRLRDDRRLLRVYGCAGPGSSRPDGSTLPLERLAGSQALSTPPATRSDVLAYERLSPAVRRGGFGTTRSA